MNLIGKIGISSAVIGLGIVAAPQANALMLTWTKGGFDNDPTGVLTVVATAPDNALDDDVIDNLEWDSWQATWSGTESFGPFEIQPSQRDANLWIYDSLQRENGGIVAENINTSDNANNVLFYSPSSLFDENTVLFAAESGSFIQSVDEWQLEPTTAVPTPAAFLPSLFGMGLSAIRKRRVASSEKK